MTNDAESTNGHPVLDVQNLHVSFRTDEGLVNAVNGISFQVHKGQTLGIVGESGSGKSVSTKAVMKLLPKNAIIGEKSAIVLRKKDGETLNVAPIDPNSSEARHLRGGEIAMIFQEPMASFSPVYTVGNQITEAIRIHRHVGKREAYDIATAMLGKVGIANPALCVRQYPHELSGGMRQRAMIAVALSTNPSLLIADEPTTALDVTIQAQILDLMRQLREDLHMSTIFITHDMGVIAHVADEVVVMYLGQIMEYGPTTDLIQQPKHPYTKGLIKAIPSLDHLQDRLIPVGGDIPSPLERPTGCPFHTRCPQHMVGLCDRKTPGVYHIDARHSVSCFLYEEGSA
jgi:peptide/nickel transport system ATP-binding protein